MAKNVILTLIVALAFFSSCRTNSAAQVGQLGDITSAEVNLLDSLEKAAQNITEHLPGVLIGSIDFNVKAKGEDLKTFKGGFIPWINLEHPEQQVSELVRADELVLPYQNISLIIDYPLNHPDTTLLIGGATGFTRSQLILKISGTYRQIYREEEDAAKSKTIPVDERTGLINRNQTDGKYGICGHDLSDLDLSSIHVYRNREGKIVIMLGVES